jgi:hypothetical protein
VAGGGNRASRAAGERGTAWGRAGRPGGVRDGPGAWRKGQNGRWCGLARAHKCWWEPPTSTLLYRLKKTPATRLIRAGPEWLDRHSSLSISAAARVKARAQIDGQQKKATTKMFGKGGWLGGLDALYPAGDEKRPLLTTPRDLIEEVTRHYSELRKSPTILNGTYGKGVDCAWPWDQPGAPDAFKLETTLTPSDGPQPKRASLHSRIADQALFSECIATLPSRKATGPDGVENEVLRLLPERERALIQQLFRVMWATGTTPAAWKHSTTVLLHKKGSTTNLKNYRPVGLTNTIYKLWTKLATCVMLDYAEQHQLLSSAQAGFRRRRSTTQQLQLLTAALEDARSHKKDIYLLLCDFSSAFDTTNHDKLLWIMWELGFPTDSVEMVKDLYTQATTSIRLPHGPTSPIAVERGTIQGDSLSPFLFLLYLEPLLRWLQVGGRGYQFSCLEKQGNDSLLHRLSSTAFADDLSAYTGSAADLRIQTSKVCLYSTWGNLVVSHEKTRATGALHSRGKGANIRLEMELKGRLMVQGKPVEVIPSTDPFPCLGNRLARLATATQSHDHKAPRSPGRTALIMCHTPPSYKNH